jgi:hypothetical protein
MHIVLSTRSRWEISSFFSCEISILDPSPRHTGMNRISRTYVRRPASCIHASIRWPALTAAGLRNVRCRKSFASLTYTKCDVPWASHVLRECHLHSCFKCFSFSRNNVQDAMFSAVDMRVLPRHAMTEKEASLW